MICKHETEWCKDHIHCETCGYYEIENPTTTISITIPKMIASITLCGAVHFNIDETMDFKKPTPEQIKNLRETFCIDVELFD